MFDYTFGKRDKWIEGSIYPLVVHLSTDGFQGMIDAFTESIIEAYENTDASYLVIVFTGTSGAIIASAATKVLQEQLGASNYGFLQIGKNSGGHHRMKTTGNPVPKGVKRSYVFVDDFISSGTTFDRCKEHVERIDGIALLTNNVETQYKEGPNEERRYTITAKK